MKANPWRILMGCSLFMGIILTACHGDLPDLPTSTTTITPIVATQSPLPSATSTSTPTFVRSVAPTATSQVTPTIQPTTQDDSSVLRFDFPTPGPAPKSAWRPPLYDVPWAPTPYDHFYFTRPIAADVVNWPLADYRYGAIWPGLANVIHTGIDIDAPKGTTVMAAAAGKVIWVGYGLVKSLPNPEDPYGLAVMIKHDFGYQGERLETVYAHLSEADVVLGQEVASGQRIGLVGNTGLTTGPHLHFEIRVEYSNYYYTTRNPELWLVPPQNWGILAGHIMQNSWTPLYAQDVYVKSLENGNTWMVRTYANSQALKEDDYYHENMVLSDLPEGKYQVYFFYKGATFLTTISIHPGLVTYLAFDFLNHFSKTPPVVPTLDVLSSATPSNP